MAKSKRTTSAKRSSHETDGAMWRAISSIVFDQLEAQSQSEPEPYRQASARRDRGLAKLRPRALANFKLLVGVLDRLANPIVIKPGSDRYLLRYLAEEKRT